MAAINRKQQVNPVNNRPVLLPLTGLLNFLIILVLLAPMRAGAGDYVAAQAYVHAFNNNVTVYSSVFALNKDVSLDTSLYGKYTVDVIGNGIFTGEGGEHGRDAVSSASSSATGGGKDIRHEATAGITHNFPGLFSIELYYDFSIEKDYQSSTPSITLKKEFFNKNTTLAFGYSRNMDDISGKFIGATLGRTTDNYYLGLTQVLSPVTIAQVGYSLSESTGYLAEGIRLVPVDGATTSSCTAESVTCLDEAFPGSRTRKAYIIGINHYFAEDQNKGDGPVINLFDRSSVKLTFRYYTDDWKIDSYTTEVEYFKYLSDNDLLRLNYRFYTQTPAFFFKKKYLSTDLLRSSSPQHRNFNSSLIGVKLTHRLKHARPAGSLGLGSVEGKYELYIDSSNTIAHILMGSLKFTF